MSYILNEGRAAGFWQDVLDHYSKDLYLPRFVDSRLHEEDEPGQAEEGVEWQHLKLPKQP